MKTTIIKQEIEFPGKPEMAYNLLMDSELHGQITGADAEISKSVGGSFRVFDGYCHGKNIELVRGKKIVQTWNFQEDGWPEDHYSVCTFLFEETKDGTRMNFIQEGVPAHKKAELEEGWMEYYWEPMKEWLTSQNEEL